MFQGKRFITRGVADGVPRAIQMFLWGLIDSLVANKLVNVDYLQIFELTATDTGGQKIIHRQEEPEYRGEYIFDNVKNPLDIKLYAIDDGEYSTMCFPEER